MRPVTDGEAFIKSLNTTVTFNVIRPQIDDKASDIESRPTLLRSPKGNQMFEDTDEKGRTRVVWNIDVHKVQELFEKELIEKSEDLDLEAGQGGKSPFRIKSTSSQHQHQVFHADSELQAGLDLELQTGSCRAYVDGEVVEYYSRTHQQWTSGAVIIAEDAHAGFIMNVLVNHGTQMRNGVGLEYVRPPLQSGELVEVFVHRDGGAFLPAIVTPDQPRAATITGYQIKVQGTGELLENIPAARLRRRFPAASPVEMYRGPALGWCKATVHPEAASSDGCGAEVLPIPGDNSKYCSASEASSGTQTLAPSANDEATAANRVKPVNVNYRPNPQDMMKTHTELKKADVDGIWTRVPLCGDDGLPEWVPSYLLRTEHQSILARSATNRI